MNILEHFGISSDDFSIVADSPELFHSNSKTTKLIAGKEVSYEITINKKKIPAYVTLESAKLTRLSLLEQQKSNGQDYWLVTGVLKPVKLNIDLLINGSRINIVDVFHSIVKESSNTQDMTRDQFILELNNMGIKLFDGMPMFFQQFGASFEAYGSAVEAFKQAGARDDLARMVREGINPGRIRACYELEEGVEVTSFELGTVDRSKSKRNQGFIDLGDALYENFLRVVTFTKEADLLKSEIEKNTSTWSQAQIKTTQNKIDNLKDMAKQYVSNWAGAQQRKVQLPNGKFEIKDQFDPANAPCGRFTMIINNNPVNVDLWTNSANANTSTVGTETSILDGKTGF